MANWFVILGARVMEDGTPSGALARRVHAALAAAAKSPSPMFLPTGGRGRSGYIEADVMKRMLVQAGIGEEQIVCERLARETLGSVRLCTRILHSRADVDRVVVCTDSYHLPRCRALFRIAGVVIEAAPIESAARQLPPWRYWYYVSREVVAFPVQTAWLALLRLLGRVA
jgi:uncharacterized SAM-binding protein YcdF (DUF218 family)